MDAELLTVPEAAAFMRQSVAFVREHQNELGRVKNGRSVRIPVAGIRAYWKRQADAETRAASAEKRAADARRRISSATDARIVQLVTGGAR